MATGQRSGIVLEQVQRLFSRGTVTGLSEGQLLARFVGDRDEVAFEAIVSRHGPMVLGICRRLLDDPHDVEDAFQATFLVLVKKARVLRDRDLLASWLYGVALRIATRSRRDRSRRRIRERTDRDVEVTTPADDVDRRELWSAIDAEVARLPARFRTPIVLCYFEGLTHDQAAERMRCPVGTVRSRMTKGRELLRSRLTRRGLAPTPAVLAVGPISGIAPAVPPALFFKTIAAAARVVAGESIVAGIVSTSAITLAQGALRTMTLTKWMTVAAAVMVLGALGGGIGVAARQQGIEPVRKAAQGQPPRSPARKDLRSGKVVAAVVGPESPANSARKALKAAEDGIIEYEKQLHTAQTEILRLNTELALLKTHVHALESRLKAEAAKRPTAGAGANSIPATAARGAGKGVSGNENAWPDTITTNRHMIVSQSATSEQVVTYATQTGAASRYRPPHGMRVYRTSAWETYVSIVALGPPGKAQLAMYRLDSNKWAIQDLHPGTRRSDIDASLDARVLPILAPHFSNPELTQLAVFDFIHSRWAVQDLIEPWNAEKDPAFKSGNLAVYVFGRHVYAYSAEAGRWDTLTLEKRLLSEPWKSWQSNASSPGSASGLSVKDNSVAVSQGGRLHIFLAKTGRWQTIDPKD